MENCCKQRNLDFIDNSNIKKSDLNSRGLHLQKRGGSKLAKNVLDCFYWACATGNGFPDQSEQRKFCIVNELRNNKLSHRILLPDVIPWVRFGEKEKWGL